MNRFIKRTEEESELEKHPNPCVRDYFTRLHELRGYLDINTEFSEESVCDWAAQCVDLFTEIGLSPYIIEGFMRTFEFKPQEGYTAVATGGGKIGPLSRRGGIESIGFLSYSHPNSENIYYVKIAFTVAKRAIQKIAEESGVVPRWLLEYLKDEKKYQNIYSSLELLDMAATIKDTEGVMKNCTTLLENILDLEPLLCALELSKKIKKLCVENSLREKFGVQKEFVFALDNSRLIRNSKVIHKSRSIKYEIPYLVAITCAHLVVMLLEFTIAKGELIS